MPHTEPIGSSGHHVPPEREKMPMLPPPRTSSKPAAKLSAPLNYASLQANKENFDEPQSANDHPGDMGES